VSAAGQLRSRCGAPARWLHAARDQTRTRRDLRSSSALRRAAQQFGWAGDTNV